MTATEGNPLSAWVNRLKYGEKHTFGEKLGQGVARFVYPFVGIPTNLAAQALKKGVPGFADLYGITKSLASTGLMGKYMKGETNWRDEMPTHIAHAILRHTATALVANMVNNDTLRGYDEEAKHNAHSIYLNGQWRDLSRIGFLGKSMALAADYVKGGGSGVMKGLFDPEANPARFKSGMIENEALVKPLIDLYRLSLEPVIDAKSYPVRGESQADTIAKNYRSAAAQVAAEHVPFPSYIPQAARSQTNEIPDTGAQLKEIRDEPFTSQFQTHVGAKAGVAADQPPPTPGVRKEQDDSWWTTTADRLFSPMQLGTEGEEPKKRYGRR